MTIQPNISDNMAKAVKDAVNANALKKTSADNTNESPFGASLTGVRRGAENTAMGAVGSLVAVGESIVHAHSSDEARFRLAAFMRLAASLQATHTSHVVKNLIELYKMVANNIISQLASDEATHNMVEIMAEKPTLEVYNATRKKEIESFSNDVLIAKDLWSPDELKALKSFEDDPNAKTPRLYPVLVINEKNEESIEHVTGADMRASMTVIKAWDVSMSHDENGARTRDKNGKRLSKKEVAENKIIHEQDLKSNPEKTVNKGDIETANKVGKIGKHHDPKQGEYGELKKAMNLKLGHDATHGTKSEQQAAKEKLKATSEKFRSIENLHEQKKIAQSEKQDTTKIDQDIDDEKDALLAIMKGATKTPSQPAEQPNVPLAGTIQKNDAQIGEYVGDMHKKPEETPAGYIPTGVDQSKVPIKPASHVKGK